jgi:hypothetical protein
MKTHVASYEKMTWMTGDDLEEICSFMDEVLSQHLRGGTEKDHEKRKENRCPGRNLN